MVTTRGQASEATPTRTEQAADIIEQAIAGRSIVRRVVLYTLAFALCVSPVPMLAVVPVGLLMATDVGL